MYKDGEKWEHKVSLSRKFLRKHTTLYPKKLSQNYGSNIYTTILNLVELQHELSGAIEL
jgi:hypothetical protein